MSETTIKERKAPALLPCPFCGGRAIGDQATVFCEEGCFAQMPHPSTGAIAAWNRRADPWIPVAERLPEGGVNVLIGVPFNGDFVVWTGYWTGCVWRDDTGGDNIDDVTHWMPLPAAPISFNSPEANHDKA